jgi:hypothetical protein
MSEHAWVRESLESYVADGLDLQERHQLEEHLAECSPCARALGEVRAIDQRLESLFREARPDPAMEDRFIQALRQVPSRVRSLRLGRWSKAVVGMAAAVLLALVGLAVSTAIEQGDRELTAKSLNNLKQIGGEVLVAQDAYKRTPLESSSADGTRGVITMDDSDSLKDANTLAREWRSNREWDYRSSLRHGSTNHGINGRKGKEGENDEFWSSGTWRADVVTATEIDPAALAPEAEIKYDSERKAEVGVPGGGWPDQSVGVERGQQKTPPSRVPPSVGTDGPVHDTSTGKTIDTKVQDKGESPPPAASMDGRKNYTYTDRQSAAPPPPPEYFKPGDLFGVHGPGNDNKETGQGGKGKLTGGGTKAADSDDDNAKKAGQGLDKEGGKGKSPKEEGGSDQGKETSKGNQDQPPPAGARRKIIIRSGDMDFEVDSFDAAVVVVTRLVVQIRGGYVDTINSKMLDNGKVRGSVVVRVPPDKLDQLILDLRKDLGKFGELKGQRIASLDITKKYTDMESRLRGARTMEERFLKIIKEGKGQIKDLIAAEKELGVWRLIIEEMEGELRYWSNQAALSTLTIKLAEKEIQRAAFITECERVQAGLEVEDVDKALREAQKAVADAKGRVTKSELKQHAAGQFSALLDFEVDPDAAGPLRDRLRQLGTMVRLEINRVQEPEGGGPAPKDRKVKRGPTQFFVSLINLANISPRETVTVKEAAEDVSAAFNKLRAAATKALARVAVSQLNEQDPKNVKAQLDFDIRRVDEPAIQAALVAAGAVLSRKVDRAPEGVNVTDAKVGFKIELVAAATLPPRETTTLRLAAADVAATYRKLREAVAGAKGHFTTEKLSEQDLKKPTAQLDFDIRKAAEGPIQKALVEAGAVLSRKVDRSPEGDALPDPRLAFKIELVAAGNLPPRETTTLKLAAPDVAGTYRKLREAVAGAKGHFTTEQVNEQDRRNPTAQLDFDIRKAAEGPMQAALVEAGAVLSRKVDRSPEGDAVPDPRLAFKVELVPASNIAPREFFKLALEVSDVDGTMAILNAQVKDAGGRAIQPQRSQESTGQITAHVYFDVPLTAAAGLFEKFKSSGLVRLQDMKSIPAAPEGKFALGRLDVTVSNPAPLVGQDEGVWGQVRKGLGTSLTGLAWSLRFIIVGVLVVLPWLILIGAIVWLVRWAYLRQEGAVPAAVSAGRGGEGTTPTSA